MTEKTFDIKNILVPIDFSETSMEALTHAIYLAKVKKATLTILNITESMRPPVTPENYSFSYGYDPQIEKTSLNESRKHIKQLAARIKKNDKIDVYSIVSVGWVSDEIIENSKKLNIDLIIMGTHGVKGFREFIIGSNTFRVVNGAHCPVLSIQKHTDHLGFNTILVPFRLKPHSREKVDYAIQMAKIYGSTIEVLGVDTEDDASELKTITLEAAQIKKIVGSHKIKCNTKVVTSNYVASDILEYAEKKNIDLIITVGDMDRMRISEYFMGPFSQQMVNHSPIPILSIRPTFNPNTIDLRGYGW